MRPRFCLGDWRPLLTRLPGRGAVGLTFDDGPTPETTPALLAALAGAGAHATFFFSGPRASAHGELVAATVAGGHTIYGHGWEHVNRNGDPDRAISDMCRVEEVLARHRPTPDVYLLRLPYNAGYATPRMHTALGRFHPNIQFAFWSLDPKDWSIPLRCGSRDAFLRECQKVATRLTRSRHLDGGIVLMHEQPFDIPSPFTAELTGMLAPLVLAGLAERGLQGVAVPPATAVVPWRRWVLAPA